MTLFIRSERLAQHGWDAIFSTRQGGCSPAPFHDLNLGFDLGDNSHYVLHNHELLLQASGLESFPHQATQVHGDHFLYCKGEGEMHAQEADGLWSDQASCLLAVRTADCVPILLADPVTGLFAAVHAGWRGTEKCIAAKMVYMMCEKGAKAEHIIASIGPCLGMCCFEINENIASALQKSVDDIQNKFVQKIEGRLYADLSLLNQYQLKMAGLAKNHIERQSRCTYCENENFFSYRRDGGKTGRGLAIITAKKL
ncbi:MAG: peptidoglycan editing factor PgeF [Mariprofundaceae bacterium]|nr:peptidoglycan editing factor PgeF [Mariprofundaceae bacterium]